MEEDLNPTDGKVVKDYNKFCIVYLFLHLYKLSLCSSMCETRTVSSLCLPFLAVTLRAKNILTQTWLVLASLQPLYAHTHTHTNFPLLLHHRMARERRGEKQGSHKQSFSLLCSGLPNSAREPSSTSIMSLSCLYGSKNPPVKT